MSTEEDYSHPLAHVNDPNYHVEPNWNIVWLAIGVIIVTDKQIREKLSGVPYKAGYAAGRAYPHVKRAAVWTAKEIDAKIKAIIEHYREKKHPPLSSVGSAYKEDIILRLVTEEMVKKDPTTTYTEVMKEIRKNLHSDPNFYEAMIRRYRGK